MSTNTAVSLGVDWKNADKVATAAVLALIGYLRSTMKHRQNEKYRAEELAQVVLKRLQDQVRSAKQYRDTRIKADVGRNIYTTRTQ